MLRRPIAVVDGLVAGLERAGDVGVNVLVEDADAHDLYGVIAAKG